MSISLPRETIDYRINLIDKHGGNLADAARASGIPRTTLQSTLDAARRVGVESPRLLGPSLRPPGAPGLFTHAGRLDLDIDNGVVLIGSDSHIWPGEPTIAMKAFLWGIKRFKKELRAVILNGDVIDGATVSRYPSIGWEKKPTLADELAASQKQLREIRALGGKGIRYIWNAGNHDLRLETAIANALPQFAGINGIHLSDHFPDWECAWATWINSEVCVKHRFKGGTHAAFNNTKDAGRTIITGHLHRLAISAFADYTGVRWGVETGTLASPYSNQFVHYTEANPVNWQSGYVVLTFRDGRLCWPQLVHAFDENSWDFAGEVYRI